MVNMAVEYVIEIEEAYSVVAPINVINPDSTGSTAQVIRQLHQ
jgi:hypothetical protein